MNRWNFSLRGLPHSLGRYSPVPLLFIVTFITYLPSLSGGFFCWDDNTVALSPLVQRLDFPQLILFFSTFHTGLYHPLTTFSFALDYKIAAGSAFPFHATNLALHITNTCLTYLLIKRLSASPAIPFVVALLFSIHPMHVEAVSWITSRKDLLYCLFMVISLLFYTYYVERSSKKFYALALLFCLFSALSKIQSAVLPLLICLVDYLFKIKFTKNVLLEKLPFFLVIAILVIVNIKAQSGQGYMEMKATFSLSDKILFFCNGFVLYLTKSIVPHPISIFYPFPENYHSSQPLITALPYALTVILFISLIIRLAITDHRDEVFGLMFFFICIVLALIVTNFRDYVIANRYTYVASIGLYYCIVSASIRIIHNNKRYKFPFIALSLFTVVLFSLLTFHENQRWKSPEQLFRKALDQYPESSIILAGLGNALIDAGMNDEAIRYLNQAISINPKNTFPYYNRGMAEYNLNRYDEALQDFSRSIELGSGFVDAWFGKGNIYLNTGEYAKALEQYSYVLAQDATYCDAWQNRATVKGRMGDFRGSIADVERAIALCPGNGSAFLIRGLAKLELGMDGCTDLRTAQSLNHGDAATAIQRFCE